MDYIHGPVPLPSGFYLVSASRKPQETDENEENGVGISVLLAPYLELP